MSLNGVDTQTLFATIDAVKAQPELAKFQFRASNRWISGTHNRSSIGGYYGAGQEFTRAADHRYDADHPPVLTGTDEGPTPVEFLLHALAACLTSGLANIAAARGIPLTEVTSTVEGDIDLRGILGLDPGYATVSRASGSTSRSAARVPPSSSRAWSPSRVRARPSSTC
jgi:organic hydroperoxide reductase OsmC/OhrA